MPRDSKEPGGEIPRGALRTIVLVLLAEQAGHGYALCKRLEERTAGAFRLSEGSLYPLLHELELEGLVEAREEPSERGRMRRTYHLTRTGRRATEGARQHWLASARLIISLLTPPEREPA